MQLNGAKAFIFGGSGLMLLIGLSAPVVNLTWICFPAVFHKPGSGKFDPTLTEITWWSLGFGVLTGLIGLALASITSPEEDSPEYSKIMFGRALVGIGFVLLLDAFINVIGLAGFASAGAMPALFQPGSTNLVLNLTTNTTTLDLASPGASPAGIAEMAPPPSLGNSVNLITAVQLLLSLGFTVMGALFFFSKSLWDKMNQDPPVKFDERIFWAGLWFRLGEAIVFMVVIFVALLFYHQYQAPGWMPFIALVIGLSVKSAENLIAGLSKRLLNAINSFIGWPDLSNDNQEEAKQNRKVGGQGEN